MIQNVPTRLHGLFRPLLLVLVMVASFCDQATRQQDYTCDGRQYCSQMTSCEEARWFLKNCPDMKMDGDGDGIPCEEQWCR